jgi:hypothetical protein
MTIRLPQPPRTLPREVHDWASQLVATLERHISGLDLPASTGWSTDNVTPSRTIDPTTATLPEVAQVLATLLADLRKRGRLG